MELLLIEDDPVTAEVLSLLLAEDGWHVTEAESGEAALMLLQNAASSPALVLCDQKLPGLSGAPLAQAIRAACGKTGGTPATLLAMSASRIAVPDGFDALLLKPFSPANVRDLFESSRRNTGTRSLPGANEASENEDWNLLPVIDEAVYRKLNASMGTDRVRDLFAFATKDAVGRVNRMRFLLAPEDREELAREAHLLKGSAGMVGARRLAALAACFEGSLDDSGTAAPSRTKLAMLTAALDDIEHMLETLFPAQP